MQIIKGTKREVTIHLWDEQISKAKKRLAYSKKCYELFGDTDSKMWIEEDEKKLAELEQHKKEAIEFMDAHEII
ncbi:MAG: hypothetical protein IJ740_08360 [Ruminococcus sp.]|nr:hypothetical protein [Ruminococcus sp.]